MLVRGRGGQVGRRLTLRGRMSCSTLCAPKDTGSGEDYISIASAAGSRQCPHHATSGQYPSRVSLTLPQRASSHRHCVRTSASTRQSIRQRRRWLQRGGRCSSRRSQHWSWMWRQGATWSNSSAINSIGNSQPPSIVRQSEMDSWELARAVGWKWGFRESYRSCLGASIASGGAGGACRAQC